MIRITDQVKCMFYGSDVLLYRYIQFWLIQIKRAKMQEPEGKQIRKDCIYIKKPAIQPKRRKVPDM